MLSQSSRSRSSSSASGALVKQSGSASFPATNALPSPKTTTRLLNETAFKAVSASDQRFSRRSKSDVSEIDKKLRAYEKLNGLPANIVKRAALLKELKKLCGDYIVAKTPTNGPRVAGVQSLLDQVNTELSFIDIFAETHTITQSDPTKALKEFFKGRDAFAKAKEANHPISSSGGQEPDIHEFYKAIIGKLGADGIRDTAMREVINDDVALLKQMSTQSGIDSLLGKIIREVMRNEDLIHFQETKGMASGAVLAGEKDILAGIRKKYRLDMQLNQTDSIIRLSSLLHEMTHISIHERFDNTAIHLAFDRRMSDEDVLKLSAVRTKQLDELEEALKSEKALFSSLQYEALMEKITYPVKGKNTLESYAKAFKTKGLSAPEYDRIMSLHNSGANNTLTEFDTVINQMFFMVNGWGIDDTSDFYTTLKGIAYEAYKHRKA